MPISFLYAILGGSCIGLAATFLLFYYGRILGASGILTSAVFEREDDGLWRWQFLGGLLVGGPVFAWVRGFPVAGATMVSLGWVVLAGLLVGFGVAMGSGCTSGHGVCGMSRLAPRSFTAVAVFLVAGMVSVFVFRKVGVLP